MAITRMHYGTALEGQLEAFAQHLALFTMHGSAIRHSFRCSTFSITYKYGLALNQMLVRL